MHRNTLSPITTLLLIPFITLSYALIPKPYEYNQTTTLCSIGETLEFTHEYHSCFILKEALKRFDEHLSLRNTPLLSNDTSTCLISSLTVNIEQSCDESENKLWPSDMMDESYTLKIAEGGIEISSQEIWGVLHALETILQLTYRSEWDSKVIYQGDISDVPVYLHRGIMIDTARHFLSVSEIEKIIDAMSMVKMNVLHWHVTDDESFPFVVSAYPQLSAQGAYNPQLMVYQRNEVSSLLEYARLRGVRVMAEFETPAHTQSWGSISNTFLTQCYKDGQPEDRYGPVNPSDEETFTALSNIFNEVLGVFPDTLLHFGGSEVTFDCWQSNPTIQEFMQTQTLGDDYNSLEDYYFRKLMETVLGANSSEWTVSPVIWEDVFDNGYRGEPATVVHVHQPEYKSVVEEATKAGYRVISSSCWKLNEKKLGDDWRKYYECDFSTFDATDDQLALLIGGEALLWGFYVDDANLFPATWPLAATVAERLWSTEPPETEVFAQELDELRCRMLRRGWSAQAITGPGFCFP
uniref:Beta-hexosaminidase n=1 Tax=Trichobilharzia regenti TaxID=157069 RepID=A0AA85J3G7_TRIRE|nr:unnamed protein product [Trichobilharzia regenti]